MGMYRIKRRQGVQMSNDSAPAQRLTLPPWNEHHLPPGMRRRAKLQWSKSNATTATDTTFPGWRGWEGVQYERRFGGRLGMLSDVGPQP